MKEILRLALSLASICLICSALVGIGYIVTKGPIEKAELDKLNQSISLVMPEGSSEPKEIEVSYDGSTYKCWETDKGFAVMLSSFSGYSGEIRLMLGFSKEGKFIRYNVLLQSETPALGSHINDTFKDHVFGKDAFETKWKVTKDGGDIDSITGATITSRAVCEIISKGTDVFRAYMEAK